MPRQRRLWTLFITPPLFFLLVTIFLSVVYQMSGATSPEEIATRVSGNIPLLILYAEILTLGLLAFILHKDRQKLFDLGIQSARPSNTAREITLGTALGIVIGISYVWWISPLHVFLQTTFGDYVPPGQVLTSLKGSILVFFLANVLLAPFVEERLYRGHGLAQLRQRYGNRKAVVISSIFFGLFHWMGGFWYMIITGVIIGVLFAILTIKRGNLLLVFSAHLALNFGEFLYVTLR